MLRALTLAALAALAPLSLAKADGVSDFYAGKSISLIISTGVGGGVDTNARLIAKHLGNHIPGAPGVLPKNMTGAGHLQATNYLYAQAARDGTFIGAILPTFVGYQVLDGRGAQYDARNFNYLGSADVENANLYTWSSLGVKRIEEVRTREVLMGATGAGSYTMLYPTLLNNMLGYKFKMLNGYPGAAEAALAMERGEIHALTQPWPILRAEKPDWIKEKKINFLLQVGVDSHPDLSVAPIVTDLARNNEERSLIEFIAGNSRVGRAITSPPGQPAERVADLRKAFMQVMQDADFLAEMKRDKLDLAPMPGEDLQRVIARSLDVSPEMVAKAKVLAEFKE